MRIVIALIISPDGLPIGYEVMRGSTSRKTTLADMLKNHRLDGLRHLWHEHPASTCAQSPGILDPRTVVETFRKNPRQLQRSGFEKASNSGSRGTPVDHGACRPDFPKRHRNLTRKPRDIHPRDHGIYKPFKNNLKNFL
jgi:hypothetical protein